MDTFIFTDRIEDIKGYQASDYLPHIFITKGSIGFDLNDRHYHARGGDCIIPSIARPLENIETSNDFEFRCMLVSLAFIDLNRMNVQYNVKGHMDLIDNPIITMLTSEMEQCLHNISEIENRALRSYHIYYDESLIRVFQLFVLDMYDIHSRNTNYSTADVPSAHIIVRKFISMLEQGEFVAHRQTSYYADRLSITPGYLTEVCKSTTNRPPGYWIDLYMATEIKNLLSDTSLSISAIAERLNFNSDSYFTRYCKRILGDTPLKLRGIIS